MHLKWRTGRMLAVVGLAVLGLVGAGDLVAPRGAGGLGTCPPGCECGDASELEVACSLPNASYLVKALPNDYARVICHYGELVPENMPFLPLSPNGTLSSLSLSGCTLPGTFSALLGRLGAVGTRRLSLVGPRGEIDSDLADGLEDCEVLMVTEAAVQRSIPFGLLARLPALRDFRLSGASLQDQTQDDEQGAIESVRMLEISASGLSSPPALDRFPALRGLLLWGNNIGSLDNTSFQGADNLQDLDLSRNPFPRLPAGMFSPAPNLRTLTLVSNQLEHLETGALSGLLHLEKVVIKFCNKQMTLGAKAFSDMPALKNLTLELCPLGGLPADVFHGTKALENLIIEECSIQVLPRGVFRDLSSLRTLTLTGNKLQMLDSDVFWPLKGLKVLRLDRNLLEVFPDQMLSGLSRLEWLSASNNRLRVVSPTAVQGAPGLRTLELQHNMLSFQPQDGPDGSSPLRWLQQLRVLRVSHNRVSAVPPDWRWTLTHLHTLDMAYNLVPELTPADVQFLGSNMSIDLRHNRISVVELMDAPPAWDQPASHAGNLMLLDHNPFRCDCGLYSLVRRLRGESRPVGAEPRMEVGAARCGGGPTDPAVRDLRPGDLVCHLLPQDCPAGCECLIRPDTSALELDCREPGPYPEPATFGLRETHLRLRTFHSLHLPPHVTILNLTAANLTEFPPVGLAHLKLLDLTNNRLKKLDQELLSTNISLRIAGNPLACDCSHWKYVSDLQKAKTVLDANQVHCESGDLLWNVDSARLCLEQRAGILAATLGCLGLAAAILIGIACRHPLRFKLFLFARGWFPSCLTEDELDLDAKYDAFVSFSQNDAKWVSEQLVRVLEDQYGYSLCVHYRDWIVGDMIPAQIARSVEQSRRTIVVLSKSFLESTWASLEFRAAHVRSKKEGRPRVLLVLLEDVNTEDLNPELKVYLTTNTYLKWGDPWFWEKLRYAMPHGTRKDVKDHVMVLDHGLGPVKVTASSGMPMAQCI